MDKIQSLPNIRATHESGGEMRKLYSLSLTHISKNSEYSMYHHKPSPFNIRWLNGYNHEAGVVNLNDKGSTTAFYGASNCGILYNWTTNQMRILQGHRHMVCFIAADSLGRWLLTGDSGPENIIIIWDGEDYFPQKTFFSPHGTAHIAKVALSSDARYMLTLAYEKQAMLYWWMWSYGLDVPHAKLEIDLPKDSVITMGFNPMNTTQFLLLTKHYIWMGASGKIFVMERGLIKETDDYELKIRCIDTKLPPEHGKYTCFTFVGPSQVLVGTSRGTVVVFGATMEFQPKAPDTDYKDMKLVKPLKIEKHHINQIHYVDGFVVTGNSAGEIHFYDEQMRLVYWIHEFKVDSVKSLSFNISPRSFEIIDPKCGQQCLCWEQVETTTDSNGVKIQKLIKRRLPCDATTAGKPFVIRDFLICSENDGVNFTDFVTEKIHVILDNKMSPALSLTVHPQKPFVCIGYKNGIVEMFNFLEHRLFKRQDLREAFKIVIPPDGDSTDCNYKTIIPNLSVTYLKYSPSGLHLACGLNTGGIVFLDPTTIELVTLTPLKDTASGIKEINFSPDSLTFAFSDFNRTVGVYKYNCNEYVWNFIGKHRAHYKEVTSLFFLPQKNESGDYKLISLGADRIMVEYDIGKSENESLEILSLDRIEQSGVPLAGIAWPTPEGLNEEDHRLDLPTILVANSEFKYKIMNYSTSMTLATVLGPRFETPVHKMQLISIKQREKYAQYILFASNTVIGLQKMPLDGNPWKHVGLLGHPEKVLQMCFREDFGFLFTIGAKDSVMSQWATNYRSVETTSTRGGGELDPYYCLIEDGRPGWLFQEIRDLFYYIQILCQGTFSPAMRRVKDYIPIDSLPDLMRALGFFPSEYDMENIIVEAKYKVYLKKPVTEIDFEEFVKLYLNHRPAFGDNIKKIRRAFMNLSSLEEGQRIINRDDLVALFEENGENFPRELTWYLLSILSGHSFEDRAGMVDDDFSFLPEDITYTEFINNILGIQDMDNVSDASGKSSASGSQTSLAMEENT